MSPDRQFRSVPILFQMPQVQMPQELLKVWADPARVGQVLRNLLDNGLTHTPSDGQIDVRIVVHQAELEVHVRNSSEPISAEQLPYVFERFHRSDRSRNRTTVGSGLGLAIVKQLIDAHGGRVWVGNLPGNGVCFGFSLRIHPPDQPS